MLENKTHNEAAGIACNILCDLVGIKTFIDMLNKYDHASTGCHLLSIFSLSLSLSLSLSPSLFLSLRLSLSLQLELTWIQFTTVNSSIHAQ